MENLFRSASLLLYPLLFLTCFLHNSNAYQTSEENADFDHSVDCADIMEPCNLDGDCCEPYVCEDGRCYFAQDDGKLDQNLGCADIMEPCAETEECCSPYVCEDSRCFFAEDDHLEGNLGCQEMSEPCERDGTLDCCEGLNCQVYSNRCF